MADELDSTEAPPEPAAKKPARKSTSATVCRRVELVLQWRLDGATLTEIRDYAAQQDPPWGVSDTQLKRYIAQSDALLKEQVERSHSRAFRLHVARRNRLYGLAMKGNDLRVALDALRDLAKLQDMYDDVPALKKELDALTRLIGEKSAAFGETPASPETSLEHRDADHPG